MQNEFILILDDEISKGGQLEQAISDAGYACELAHTIPEAEYILESREVSFLVLDVLLTKIDPTLTSIDFAKKISPVRPTLFVTQLSNRSEDNRHFQRIVQELPHADYVSRRAINWTEDVIRGITLAKEKFRLYEFNENNKTINTIPIKDKITFNEWHGHRRVFLEKDKICFITSDKRRKEKYSKQGLNRGLQDDQIDAFSNAVKKPGEFCVFYTTDKKFIPFGTRIGMLEDQLEKYRSLGWNLARVHNQYIVNMDLVEEFVDGDYLKLSNCDYLIPTTFFRDGDASSFFPFLQS